MQIALCGANAQQAKIFYSQLVKAIPSDTNLEMKNFSGLNKLEHEIEQGKQFDIYVLDTEMNVTAMNLIDKIKQYNLDTYVVLLTDTFNHITQAFHAGVDQYFVKPLTDQAVIPAMRTLFEVYNEKHIKIFDYEGNAKIISLDRVIFTESYYKKLRLVTMDGKIYEMPYFGKREQEQIRKSGFLKTHQRYFVNPTYILSIQNRVVSCKGDVVVPISVRCRKQLIEAFHQYIKQHY